MGGFQTQRSRDARIARSAAVDVTFFSAS